MRSRVFQLCISVLAVLILAAFPAAAHLFNHQDRHEVCAIYGAPHHHSPDDGHAHWHHLEAAPEAHLHGATLHPAGHTHADVFHDPCDQVGMLAMDFRDAPAMPEVTLPEGVIGERERDAVMAILRDAGEAFRLPVPHLTMQDTLVIIGDDMLATFPGTGTREDPHRIEGYHIRGSLELRDTSRCVIVRNNVVYNDLVQGPILDPDAILDLERLVAELEASLADATAALGIAQTALAADTPAYEAVRAELMERKAVLSAVNAEWRALSDAVAAANAAHLSARADALVTMDAIRNTTRELRTALAARNVTLPAEPPLETEPADPIFGSFAVEVARIAAEAPQDDRVDALQAELAALRAAYDGQAPLVVSTAETLAAARAAQESFRPTLDAARAAHAAWVEAFWAPAAARRAALVDAFEAARTALNAARASLDDARLRLADHRFELGGLPFDTLDEIARHVLSLIPAPEQARPGRLVLDWNGQCVHAYHNVVQDLRVNQNNMRKGYATGGLIEDNRIFTIGQIRHYDGELRQNEIGDRLYLEEYLAGDADDRPADLGGDAYPTGSPPGGPALAALRAGRSINADGFNEAWIHDNVIYGSVDLDFHGHHHGPGFFARESHFHGDVFGVAYMVNATTGACAYPTPGQPGPLAPIAPEILDGPEGCLPHHDHAKRWTSVRFERNVILDPLGYGLRYEDVDHAADDRFANSESMRELDRPHFHRTHVALADNVVLGSVWIDVFNADGIELWDDDYSEVRRDRFGAVIGLVDHLGARIVESHPMRNDGWLDVVGNAVFVVDKERGIRGGHDPWSAFQLNDAKEVHVDLSGNRAHLAGRGFDAGVATPAALVDVLREVAAMPADAGQARVEAWGGDHPTHPASHGVLLRRASDAHVRVCGNEMLGFARGLEAASEIRPDVAFVDCRDNNWGGAFPSFRVVTTPAPDEGMRVFDPLRQAGAGTPVERHVHSAADHGSVILRVR